MNRDKIRTQISAFKPGRELDAQVSRHVFKLDVVYDEITKHNQIEIIDHPKFNNVPCYSTDISAAWIVVNAWRRGYSYGTLDINCADIAGETCWTCQFGNNTRAEGKTAPEAICKAALLAVMGL